MTVRLEELLAAATQGEWSSSPVAWETSLRSRIPFNAEDAALIAGWIALAPDAVRLLIDMGKELRSANGTLHDTVDIPRWRVDALLARLDRLGNTT